jgi:hypothetical protein
LKPWGVLDSGEVWYGLIAAGSDLAAETDVPAWLPRTTWSAPSLSRTTWRLHAASAGSTSHIIARRPHLSLAFLLRPLSCLEPTLPSSSSSELAFIISSPFAPSPLDSQLSSPTRTDLPLLQPMARDTQYTVYVSWVENDETKIKDISAFGEFSSDEDEEPEELFGEDYSHIPGHLTIGSELVGRLDYRSFRITS